MALKLVVSNECGSDVVIGEILIVFTRTDVSVSCSDYVKAHPERAIAHLAKLKNELIALIEYSNLA